MPDRVQETLLSLRVDTDRTAPADSVSVRRRGDQRSRHQAVGSALPVAALLAGAIGISGSLGGNDRADAPPANPTVSTTRQSIAPQPFLAPTDLTNLGGYDGVGPFIDAGEAPPVPDARDCRVRPAQWGAAEVRGDRYYQEGSDAQVFEYVLRFDDAADAEQAALKRAYTDLVATCPATVDPTEGTLSTRESVLVPGLDGAVRHSRYFVPEFASEPNYYEVATAHQGTVLVVLEWRASGNPGEESSGWAWDAARLQTALDRAAG